MTRITLILVLLFVSTIGFSQTKKVVNDNSANTENKLSTDVDVKNFKDFIGVYLLVEGHLKLKIALEKNKMYIVSPWGKDPLVIKDKITLLEPTRGIYLSAIKGKKDLKYLQNGYETVLKRKN